MNPHFQNKTWLLAVVLVIVVLTYGFFELSVHQSDLSESEKAELAQEALQSASRNFIQFENQFARQSNRLANLAQMEIKGESTRKSIYNEIEKEFDFWGISIFESELLWLWNGFGMQHYPSRAGDFDKRQYVDVERQNNVVFLTSHIPFYAEQGDSLIRYDVFTRKKIQQENILPIGRNVELEPSHLFQSTNDFPVYFNFFDAVPANAQFKTPLSTHSLDSVGVAYTLFDDYEQFQSAQQYQHLLYRASFYLLFILIALLLLNTFAKELPIWKSLLLKIFGITIAWLIFSNIEYGLEWIAMFPGISQEQLQTIRLLLSYCINTLFVLFVTIATFNTLLKIDTDSQAFSGEVTGAASLFFGVISSLLLYFYIAESYVLFVESTIPLMDLNVFPAWDTLILYISSGIFAFSLISLLCLVSWFLMKIATQQWWLTLIAIVGGFILGIILLSFFTTLTYSFEWIAFTISLSMFVVLIFTILIYMSPDVLEYSSRLRLLLLFGYIAACITYIAIYKGYSERLNNQMLLAAESFTEQEASEAERIARNLLTSLEGALKGLTTDDLLERPAFVENQFMQRTRQLISPEWESFSISTQLVNNSGEIIGEYTSDLDSPSWTRAFNMLSLEIPFRQERIRIDNLRPIVRERPLNEAKSNYSSFRRAWIPLHEESGNRVGWILCSVYRERPQFEKPLRAVIATEANESWDSSINVTEYINGQPARTSIEGIPLELPAYIRLPEAVVNKVQQDSVFFRTETLGNEKIRELFVSTAENQVIRAATSHPGFENHLFSLLRYFFCILIGGLILLGFLSWKKELNILGHNRRFRDRLLDRFILATLVCLMILTVTSYYAINNQNEKYVRDQLLDKVSNLAEALSEQALPANGQPVISLNELSSALDSDASLYHKEMLDVSTTTQIYGQHLLPRLLPWDVYDSIYNEGNNQETRKVVLGNHELLIGYQPWLNEEGEIAGIVAIPTFLKAPKFNEQLLSTTSYLLGFYVVIFGFFILGAALISTQLTSPLYALREGLKKISGGNLQTTLPVKSKDEIGSLTNAYNVMVYRLKELQQDLAKAEREAAWKEMAQQVAHEIKNPLTPMKLNLQHLERQLKVPQTDFHKMKPQIEKIAANMIEQIESLNQIASDFSKFARPVEYQLQPLEVNELLQSVAELYEPDNNITLKTELHTSDLWVMGAKDEIRRVLINLVKNAYEAMPGGGKITIRSDFDSHSASVLFSVSDEGEGIPKEYQEKIFVPNFSTKSSGTGLGLAITKKIIEEHGGHISFVSTFGQGSTFTITLPTAPKK